MSKQAAASMRRRKQLFIIYSGFLLIWAVSIALMPIGSAYRDTFRPLMMISGALFWLGAIGTIFLAIKINLARRGSLKFNQSYGKRKQLGLIHFCQNKPAMIADVAMFVAGVGFIIAKFLVKELYIPFVLLAVFIFAFGMHCMLNGINYIYITSQIKNKKEHEEDE